MIRRSAAALVAVLVLVAASVADAKKKKEPKGQELVDDQTGYKLTLPAGWEATTAPDGVHAAWTDGTNLVVVAKTIGGADADDDEADEVFARLEETLADSFEGYKKISTKRRELGKKKKTRIPAYDVWFKATRDGEKIVVGARFLFFKGHVLTLMVDAPGVKKAPKALKKLLESFAPLK